MSPTDHTDPAGRDASAIDRAAVSWPLVERRRSVLDATPRATITTPLWPFRVLALLGAAWLSAEGLTSSNLRVLVGLIIAVVITAVLVALPTPYDRPTTISRIVAEQSAVTLLVVLTGAWPSPFAILLIPTAMLAGFARGIRFALVLTLASGLVLSAQHVSFTSVDDALRRSLLWVGVLALVSFTCGLAQQASRSATHQREQALARMSQLAEANALLFALQRLAQSLPASLDLDDVVDSTLQRVRTLVPADAMALYLATDADRRLERYRSIGGSMPATIDLATAAQGVRSALEAPRTVLLARLDAGAGLTPHGASAVYSALRARGTVVGLLVLESDEAGIHDQQDAEVVHGLAESFGIAIDNARLFRSIRVASADEERSRIARDLHDRVGSSLAFLGWEIDRARELASRGDAIDPLLDDLRLHLTGVVHDVRETLHDLRSDVSDDRPLATVLGAHLERVQERSGLVTHLEVDARARLTPGVERELWRLALEAITNVERHAQASSVHVGYHVGANEARLVVADDGVGLNPGAIAADRYGMIGMRERAQAIGAVIRFESRPGGGTTVTVSVDRAQERRS